MVRYYYIEEKDLTVEVILAIWQHLSHFNHSNLNFFHSTSSFYEGNLNSPAVASTKHCRLENFIDPATEEDNSSFFLHSNFVNENNFNEEFFHLRNSTFISFFIDNMIDVPICFKKSHSLKTKNFELPLLKFSNLLMKKGKREKLLYNLFKAMRVLYKTFKTDKIITSEEDFNWVNLYLFSTHYLLRQDFFDQAQWVLNYKESVDLTFNHSAVDFDKIISNDLFIKNYLLSQISRTLPVFSYFIYSVDKNVRKFSRGKSGKYVFIWKYIAPYKRLYLVMRWIVKDIKFYQSRKFSERLTKTFTNLTLAPEKSFAWKSKIFSHNHVFKNFRKSLMTSLRTTL